MPGPSVRAKRDRVSTEGLGKTDVVWLTVDHRSLFYRRSVCALLALLSMTPGQIPCLGRACCHALVTGSKYHALLWVCAPTFQGRLLLLPHLVTAPGPTTRTSVSFPPAAASDFSSSKEHSQLPLLRALPSVPVSGLCCFASSPPRRLCSAHTVPGLSSQGLVSPSCSLFQPRLLPTDRTCLSTSSSSKTTPVKVTFVVEAPLLKVMTVPARLPPVMLQPLLLAWLPSRNTRPHLLGSC